MWWPKIGCAATWLKHVRSRSRDQLRPPLALERAHAAQVEVRFGRPC